MEKKCLDCGEVIKGRLDKKFCFDQCRNNYNNHLNRDNTNLMRQVNSILRRNHRILSKLNPTDKLRVHREQLVKQGFDFNYYTNTYTTKKGTVYYFCYEHGYLPLGKDYYFLVIRKNDRRQVEEKTGS